MFSLAAPRDRRPRADSNKQHEPGFQGEMRLFTTPDEVATLVALLASPRTSNATGSNYIIDGGLIKTM